MGHLVRGLALVQAWVDRHGAAVLITADPTGPWTDRYAAEGCAVLGLHDVEPPADWWVVDGYQLDASDRPTTGCRVLLVDDHDTTGTAGAGASLALDQNLGADAARYPLAAGALAGPRYALLRRAFTDARTERSTRPTALRLVVILGGAPSPEVRALGEAVAADPQLGTLDIRVLGGSDDVPAELAVADLALAAAGTVSWELCCMGVPVVLVAVAPNQEPVAAHLASIGAALRADADAANVVAALADLAHDPERRSVMSRVGPSLVDGAGARRVVARLRSELLDMRDVTVGDARLLHDWGNDPSTRSASFSSEPIAWDEHVTWLEERLGRPSATSLLAVDGDGTPVGLVRFDDTEPGAAEIGVTVAPLRRGEGWGGALIDAGVRRWARARGPVRVDARIKVGNVASERAFVDADFDPAPSGVPGVLRYARSLDGDHRHT
jgi:UDP-2,4-diacetamido-2,4,6-trideoxy-beta-L-altropyranose hydrolase